MPVTNAEIDTLVASMITAIDSAIASAEQISLLKKYVLHIKYGCETSIDEITRVRTTVCTTLPKSLDYPNGDMSEGSRTQIFDAIETVFNNL